MEAITLEAIHSELLSLQMALSKPAKIAVSVTEAANIMGISRSTLYELLADKELKYSSIGGKKVIKIKEIEDYLNWKEVKSKRK